MNGQQSKRPVLRCVAAGMLGAMAGASCKAAASSIALLAKFSVHNATIAQGLSLLFYLGYILFTWRSWIHYVAGMDGIPSLQAAVISSSTNSLTMGCIAWLVFDEQLTLQWCLGVGLMLLGVFLLSKASVAKEKAA